MMRDTTLLEYRIKDLGLVVGIPKQKKMGNKKITWGLRYDTHLRYVIQ